VHEIKIEKLEGVNNEMARCNFLLKCQKCGETIRANSVDDGFHTFDELYNHRQSLFCLLMNSNSDISWKSRKHEDGSMFDGDWFVAGMHLPTGDITYHLEGRFWDMAKVKEMEFAPKWDGHTADNVLVRMAKYAA